MDLKYLLEVDDQGTPTIKNFDSTLDNSAKKTGKASSKMASSFKRIKKSAKAAVVPVVALAAATATFLFTLKKITNLADIYISLENRIKTVTSSNEELRSTFKRLSEISNKTRASFSATTELYVRTTAATKNLGLSTETMFEFIEKLNKAVIVSGATTIEAENAIRQLTQGLSSGALRGEELRAVLEQLPVVAAAIEKHLGITRGELRKMGEEGKISASIVIESILNADKVIKDFEASTLTTGQAMTILNNKIIVVGGNIGKKLTPVVNILIGEIITVADKLGDWIAKNDQLVKSNVIEFAKGFVNVLTFIVKAGISVVKIANAINAVWLSIKLLFGALGEVATLFIKALLFGLGKVGRFITVVLLNPLNAVRKGFVLAAIGIANLARVAATSQERFNQMNERILTLKRELAKLNKIEPSGVNSFSTAMESGVKQMDKNLAVLREFQNEQDIAFSKGKKNADNLDKLREGVTKLNEEIQKNLDKEAVRVSLPETVAAKSPGVKKDPAVLAQEQEAARAAAIEEVRIAKERDALILASAKELTAFLSVENEARFAAIEADTDKKLAAADFLRSQEILGIVEHQNLINEILLAEESRRDLIKAEAAEMELVRVQAIRAAEIESLITHEQALFDAQAGGLFARNAAIQQSQVATLKANKKLFDAEKNLEKKKSKQLQVGAAQLGGALLNIAQQQGGKRFEQAKKLAIAEATVNTIAAAVESFKNLGGWPVGLLGIAGALATGFAQVSSIKSTSLGGGGGSAAGGGGGGISGGGGGFGSAPGSDSFTAPALPEIPEQPQQVVINIQGFVGDEAQLTSALAEIIQDATGDNVDFGLQVGQQ